VRESRDSHGFVLKLDYHRGGDAIALKAPSAKEAKDWVGTIEKARLRTIDGRTACGLISEFGPFLGTLISHAFLTKKTSWIAILHTAPSAITTILDHLKHNGAWEQA
jgi:hypothetical protein